MSTRLVAASLANLVDDALDETKKGGDMARAHVLAILALTEAVRELTLAVELAGPR